MTRRSFMSWQKAWKMFRKEERGAFRCYRLRMEEAAKAGRKEGGYD